MSAIRKREWISPKGEPKTAWLVDYRDNLGKRRAKQFSRKKDAEAWLVSAAWQVKQGTHTADSQSITVEKAAELWIAKAKINRLEWSTLKQYQELAKLHIVPLLGNHKLSQVTRPMLEQYRDDLVATRSKAMTQKAVQALSSIFAEAQRKGLVAQNVAAGIKVGGKGRDKGKIEIPTRAELRALLDACDVSQKPLIMTAIMTGLRSSELRGLRWKDIDFQEKRITVAERADQRCVIGELKSAAAYRSIPVPSTLTATLKEWKLACVRNKLDLVFPSTKGTVRGHHNFIRDHFNPLQVTAGLTRPAFHKDGRPKIDKNGEPVLTGKYGLHALRHAAASGWIAQNVDLKRLQTWIGHASIQITLDTYGHLIEDKERDAAIAEASQSYLTG
jgi:integrase